MTRKLKSIALTLATALAAASPAMLQQGMAQQIGTATAVNPSTEGTPPGGSTTRLTIGARVLHKERIHTSPTGSVQLLFLDKSNDLGDRRVRLRSRFQERPHADQIDARHIAIYRRRAQPPGRGHG